MQNLELDNFFKYINSRNGQVMRFPYLAIWTAESQSLDLQAKRISLTWLPRPTQALDCLATFILSIFLPPWFSDVCVKRLAELAYKNRYEGQWKYLQYFMENISGPSDLLYLIKINSFERTFYGNLLPRVEQVCRRYGNPRIKKYWQREPGTFGPVTERVYRRGYRDKGSLRPYDQRGRNLPDPDPGVDLRNFVEDSHWIPDSKRDRTEILQMEHWVKCRFPEEEGGEENVHGLLSTETSRTDTGISSSEEQGFSSASEEFGFKSQVGIFPDLGTDSKEGTSYDRTSTSEACIEQTPNSGSKNPQGSQFGRNSRSVFRVGKRFQRLKALSRARRFSCKRS